MAFSDNQQQIEREAQYTEFLERYYRDELGDLAQHYPQERQSLTIEWMDLYQFDAALAESFREDPKQHTDLLDEALTQVDLPVDVSFTDATVRVQAPKTETMTYAVDETRSRHCGTYVALAGQISKAGPVRPKLVEGVYECQRCGARTTIPQIDEELSEPHECQGCERKGPFRRLDGASTFVDHQLLRLQQPPEEVNGGTGRHIDVHAKGDDFVDELQTGDRVTLSGTFELGELDDNGLADPYLDGRAARVEQTDYEEIDVQAYSDQIEQLAAGEAGDPFELLRASLAPKIHGRQTLKLAIILQLFGGNHVEYPTDEADRGDSHILLLGDPGTAKCVKGDTTITLADGTREQISGLVDRHLTDPEPTVDGGVYQEVDIPVPSVNDQGRIEICQANAVMKFPAPDRMYRIHTQSGRQLEVTPSHPLFTPGTTNAITPVQAVDLSPGDFIATPRELPSSDDSLAEIDASYRRSRSNGAVRLNKPDRWTPQLARLLGYTIADGHTRYIPPTEAEVAVTNSDPEILADIRAGFESLGANPGTDTPRPSAPSTAIRCGSVEHVSYLSDLAPAILNKSPNRRVPSQIFRCPLDVKRGFLRAYVECECHVTTTQREIVVSSSSRELLEDVRGLLLEFGVWATIGDSPTAAQYNDSFRLRISGADCSRYVQHIGFITERKGSAANQAVADGGDPNTNTDVVPVSPAVVRTSRESLGLTQTDYGLPRSTYAHYEQGNRNPSRRAIRTVSKTFDQRAENREVDTPSEADTLRQLAMSDIRWDKIQSIEPVIPDYDWVYDVRVTGTHSFVSNDVFSHNSSLLEAVERLAPRSASASGQGASASGLTAAAVSDDFGETQWSLDAGALVLADKGIACIDELDKIDEKAVSSLHGALESQRVSVNKAGINTTLPCRTALLAAGNPKYGRFDEYEALADQVDIKPTLLSRFDLMFLIQDQPDEETDRTLANHMVEYRQDGIAAQDEETEDAEFSVPVPAEVFRAWIAHAKRRVQPSIRDPSVREDLVSSFTTLRQANPDDGAVPVTFRKLEGLQRLAEASARVRLSETVEKEDVTRARQLVGESMRQVGMDPETGEYDADVIETGTSQSQHERIQTLTAIITDLRDDGSAGAPFDLVVEEATTTGMSESAARDTIQKLRNQGKVYSPATSEHGDELRLTK